jgi:exosortase
MAVPLRALSAAALVTGALLLVYWQVFARLVDAWIVDGNYSHGFLILPLAGYFAWERRARLGAAAVRPSWLGLPIIAGGIMVLLAGLLGSELFLTRVSLLFTLVGIVLFLFGWAHLRILMFPLAFLLLMIPIPTIIFNQIAFPLQLFASRVGESAIAAAGIPVLREGNVIVLANTSLEVAEACSGIRSLISLLTLGLVYGYFADPRGWVRAAIAASTVPVAILANGGRVAGTGIAAHWYGREAAEGFFHDFSGWAVFVVAFAMMLLVQQTIVRLVPRRRSDPDRAALESTPVLPGGPSAGSLEPAKGSKPLS